MSFDPEGAAQWLKEYVARELTLDPATVDLDHSLTDLGLDSVDAVMMAALMEEHFGVALEPTVLLQYPTLTAMIEAKARKRPG